APTSPIVPWCFAIEFLNARYHRRSALHPIPLLVVASSRTPRRRRNYLFPIQTCPRTQNRFFSSKSNCAEISAQLPGLTLFHAERPRYEASQVFFEHAR